ncbi:MAG: VWA domain-containing protein [Gammaproteobacteria bacterium]|nr:VWA domain-containing protein [Gammaproteobacteria bacterium]
MQTNIYLLWPTKIIGICLAVTQLMGCVSFERLVKVPTESKLITVGNYNTGLHRQSIHIFNPIALDSRVTELRLQPRVENLFFVVDQSSALSGEFKGVETQLYAREIVRRFIRTMPMKKYSGAILAFEQQIDPRHQEFQLTDYSVGDIEQALTSAASMQRIIGDSLATALDQVSELVAQVDGSSAVILVTAWSQVDIALEHSVMRMRQQSQFRGGIKIVQSSSEPIPWKAAGSGVCLYTVGVGNQLSRTLLETVDSCGFSVAANKIAQPRDMVHFVQTVLYKGPADSDGDGIYDYRDRCPNTTKGRIVDYTGCLRFAAIERGNI